MSPYRGKPLYGSVFLLQKIMVTYTSIESVSASFFIKEKVMNVYFWCLAIMYSMQMLTMGITQYVVFNTVTPTQAVIVMGVVSLFMSSAAYLMDKDYIKEMVWKYRYTIIVVEGSTTVILSIVVFLVGVTQEMLIARWIVLGTICEVLAFAIRFLFEKMKS